MVDFCISTFREHTNCVRCVVFSPDDRTVVTGGNDTKVFFLTADEESRILKVVDLNAVPHFATWSRCGTRVAFCSYIRERAYGAEYSVWEVDNATKLSSIRKVRREGYFMSVSSDLRLLIACNWGEKIQVFDAFSSHRITDLRINGNANSFAINPDGKRVAVGSICGMLCQFDVATGKIIGDARHHSQRINCVSYNPAGSRIVTAGDDSRVIVWNAETFKKICSFNSHEQSVICASFSPDGKYVISGGYDTFAFVWRVDNGVEICKLRGHSNGVVCAAMNSDNTLAVTGGYDSEVKFWRVFNRKTSSEA